jgi:hypothetical protein
MSAGEKIATALNIGGESMTMGLVGDEAAAAADAAIGRGSYVERLAHHRGNEEKFREENPKTAFVAEVAPALLPGAGGAKAAAALSNVAGRAGAGALMGAGAGAAYGFMEGEGGAEERGASARNSMILGSLFGATAPAVTSAIGNLPQKLRGVFGFAQKRPTIEAQRSAKNWAYKAVDQSGEVFSGDDMTSLHSSVEQAFQAKHYVEETDNASKAVLTILKRRQGKPTTLSQLDGMRQALWKRYAGAKDQPAILDAIGEIDNLINSRAGASDLMEAARAANSRYAKSQLLHNAFQKAQDQTASAGSGGNIVNKYRQAVARIIDDPKKAKFFSQEEIDLMRGFVRGTFGENTKRLIGKLSPNGNGLMMALHVVGGMASQGGTLPLMAVGAAAKNSADRGVMRGAEVLQDVVSGFSQPPARPQLNALQSALITAGGPVAERSTNALANMLPHPR